MSFQPGCPSHVAEPQGTAWGGRGEGAGREASFVFCPSRDRGPENRLPEGSFPVAPPRGPSPGMSNDFCAQTLNSDVKPGFPKTINPNDSAVLKAARHSVERFNNCTNDIFLFKESHISRALVQIVKGLKYMLDMEIGRTSCKKTQHPSLDNCDFQTNHTLQRTFSCYSEVWVIPWLQRFEVPVLHCQ
ncbi:cystatin-F isoform X2 [Lynx rufus]|uniref:cystatin-F isoform X2 n=1 Tax=Lynx rufus TaxID=61384 RepID=UPI001F12317A|nr:cystatin-F isoform X2 [Lynx rufus]